MISCNRASAPLRDLPPATRHFRTWIQDASRSPTAHSSSRRTMRRRLHDEIIICRESDNICDLLFLPAFLFSNPSPIMLRHAAWLTDSKFVVRSSFRQQYRRVSDMDVGSLGPCLLSTRPEIYSPNTSQDQPKTARTLPTRRQQGPKRTPQRAQKEPKKAPRRSGGASGRPKRQQLRVGSQPRPSCSKNWAGSGMFWGPFWGPRWVPKRPKWTPERAQKRRPKVSDAKYPTRARKSAVRGVLGRPGEAKISQKL